MKKQSNHHWRAVTDNTALPYDVAAILCGVTKKGFRAGQNSYHRGSVKIFLPARDDLAEFPEDLVTLTPADIARLEVLRQNAQSQIRRTGGLR